MQKYIRLIKDYSKNNYMKIMRNPSGLLKNPYIVPGTECYAVQLWDWDSWLTDVGIRQIRSDIGTDNIEFFECEKGCIANFAICSENDGKMPIVISPDGAVPAIGSTDVSNIHKPCYAQHIAFIAMQRGGDCLWAADYFETATKFLQYYRTHFYHTQTGLYFWNDDTAIGVDNDPCTFYRPHKSSASIYLNCLMYKELLAMEYICNALGKDGSGYSDEAKRLKKAVNDHMWDERNGFYYSVDIDLLPIIPGEQLHSGAPRHWDCLIRKIDVWSGFMAMWAGIAAGKRAERMVHENMMCEKTFNAKYGIRTLSKLEKMYCIRKTGNPSCWLGPVWGISNYMCFRSLVKYGYNSEARILAEKTIYVMGNSIQQCGQMHEYYNPDTGDGVNNPGFQSWNFLVNNMIAWYEGRKYISEF